MPGPPVVVCKGDQIIVTVINKLHGATATLHFHGKQIIDIPDRLRSAAREKLHISNNINVGLKSNICIIGEHFKNGDQYFDGVPFITQCPILPGSK